MARYLCLAGPDLGDRLADLPRLRLADEARLVVDETSLMLWTSGDLPVRRLAGGGVLLGEILARPGGPALTALDTFAATLPRAPVEAAKRLVRETWGAYLVIFPEAPGDVRVFRDPSGGLDALCWSVDGFAVVASDMELVPPGLWPRGIGLDWTAIADMFDDPIAAVAQTALTGVVAPLPGRLDPVGDGRSGEVIWSPAMAASRSVDDPEGEDLAALVDACVQGLTRPHRRLVGEISGGLDSAIVCGALAAAGEAGRAVAWLNFFGDRPEGDERRYARLVAARHGLALTEIPKRFRELSEADFHPLCLNARPPVAAADPVRDEETAARLAGSGATALLSGQGGDAVFFQPPSPLVLADRLHAEGMRGLTSHALVEAARLSRRSIWSVLQAASRSRRPALPPASRLALPAGWSRGARGYVHPWFAAAATLPPAKRLQVQGIANAQLARADSRRRRSGALLYPLLAQPVVDHVLALPTYRLARGGRERGLARHAFRDRLPTEIVHRRGKGDLSAFYGHMIAASLDFLRPHLIDGVLSEAGVLDRASLDVLLSPEQLIWRGGASGILQAAIIESWVRHWQTRLPDSPMVARPRR